MVVLIVLNIILIVTLVFLLIFLFRKKNDDVKTINVNNDKYEKKEIVNHKRDKKNSERVFVGRFISDEEYQQMMNSRKSDIAILLEEVEREYEHLKELNK